MFEETVYILENGEELSVTKSVAMILEENAHIFYCPECDCYHIDTFSSWEKIAEAIKEINNA